MKNKEFRTLELPIDLLLTSHLKIFTSISTNYSFNIGTKERAKVFYEEKAKMKIKNKNYDFLKLNQEP